MSPRKKVTQEAIRDPELQRLRDLVVEAQGHVSWCLHRHDNRRLDGVKDDSPLREWLASAALALSTTHTEEGA